MKYKNKGSFLIFKISLEVFCTLSLCIVAYCVIILAKVEHETRII